MKILHTSDWHLGRSLYGRKRYEEFAAFLAWLAEIIESKAVDALLVAGDVFDTSTPSNRAQELYYGFLSKMAGSSCRHVVLIGGNHDSPTFLDAPAGLLRALRVHVVGSPPENIRDELLLLRNAEGDPEAIVCAVPYLRDRDLRQAEAGESWENKQEKLKEGIRKHYAGVGALAKAMRTESGLEIPIIMMGHLFTAGARRIEGDGVRELYVGSLAHVEAATFPDCTDYLALGHLHVAQDIGNSPLMRYSGSPLPIGFGEAKQRKSVCLVDFSSSVPKLELIEVPGFQKLESIRGNWEDISRRLLELSAEKAESWLEIIYEGDEIISDFREKLDQAIAGSRLEILRVKNMRIIERSLEQSSRDESLDDLSPEDVFDRCLEHHEVPNSQRPQLRLSFREIISDLDEKDLRAE